MKKRIFALFLTLALLVQVLPAAAGAAETDNVTREQAICAFVTAAGSSLTKDPADLSVFSDAGEIGAEYRDGMALAVGNGLVKGNGSMALLPKDTISRVEAMVILSRCLGDIPAVREALAFQDVPAWAAADIDKLSAAGIVNGYSDVQLGSQDLLSEVQLGLLTSRVEGRTASGSPWTYTSIIGNLPDEAPSPKDDLYTAYTYSWLSANQSVPAGYAKYGVREELTEANKAKMSKLLQDKSAKGTDAALVQTLYRAALDMDARNAAGVEPLKPYIDEIMKISSLDEMTAYLTGDSFKMVYPMFNLQHFGYPYNTKEYMILVMPDDMAYDMLEPGQSSVFAEPMKWLGITEADAKAMDESASALMMQLLAAFSQDMAGMDLSSKPAMLKSLTNPYTLQELDKASPSFPLSGMLKAGGYEKVPHLSICSPAWLACINELYTEENLPGFKGKLIHDIIYKAAPYLDEKSVAWSDALFAQLNGYAPPASAQDKAFAACQAVLPFPMNQAFSENYLTEQTKTDVMKMIQDIRAVLRGRLKTADWMSAATRTKALEKLDSIAVYIGGGKARDYSGLSLPSGSLAEQVFAAWKFTTQATAKELSAPPAKGYAPLSNSVNAEFEVGAFYNAQDNSINIQSGILQPPFYYAEGSRETRYFALGAIIGHELTHAFDPNGSGFDKDGSLVNWWESADLENFNARNQKVKDYFGKIEVKPGEFLYADHCIGEITADLGGLSFILEIAKSWGNADYTLAFKTYTELWPEVVGSEMASTLLQNDEHPPKYVRVNAIAQQFEEFYKTFDVTEEDGMYLAPEARVSVW